MFKPLFNDLSTFEKERFGGYLNNVFSYAVKVIIKYYHEKEYTAYKICKDNPEKHGGETSMKQLIKSLKHLEPWKATRYWPPVNINNTLKRRSRRGNDLFSRKLSQDSCALKDITEELKILESSVQSTIKKEKKTANE